jgi:hypothetical protein
MNEELIRAFIYTVDWANVDASAVLCAYASFGNDVGHACLVVSCDLKSLELR